MNRARLFALLSLLAMYGPANAAHYWAMEGAHLIPGFEVVTLDNATGNCWSNATAVKTAVHKILRKNGLNIAEGDQAKRQQGIGKIVIDVLAGRLENGPCNGTLRISLVILGTHYVEPDVIFGNLELGTYLATFLLDENANATTLEQAENFARELVNHITEQRARDH